MPECPKKKKKKLHRWTLCNPRSSKQTLHLLVFSSYFLFVFWLFVTVFVFALDVVKVSLCVFSLFFFYRAVVDSQCSVYLAGISCEIFLYMYLWVSIRICIYLSCICLSAYSCGRLEHHDKVFPSCVVSNLKLYNAHTTNSCWRTPQIPFAYFPKTSRGSRSKKNFKINFVCLLQ